MTLTEAAAVLGCSKASLSLIRAGKYPSEDSAIAARYARLIDLIDRERRAAALDADAICQACPREDCDGCRVAEI